MAPTSTLDHPAEIVLRNGQPYIACTGCNGTGDPQQDGDPFCTVCFGSTWEPVFDPRRFAFARHQAAGISAPSVDAPERHGNGSGSGSSKPEYTNRYAGKCIKCGGWVEANAGLRIMEGQGWATIHAIGQCIDKEAKVTAPAHRPNKFAGKCERCGQHVEAEAGKLVNVSKMVGKNQAVNKWGVEHLVCPPVQAELVPTEGLDLSALPTGRYAVPGGDTRLKLFVQHGKGNWEGFIFVKDAAKYGQGQRYGKQAPGGRYVGRVQDALRAILADPKAASVAYGHLTSTCGRCGRPLEDAESIAAGIGPICAEKEW